MVSKEEKQAELLKYKKLIKKFVSDYCDIPVESLKKETKLEDDLKITGDDALEFFEAFYQEFKVDLTNLSLDKYFGGEGVGLIDFSFLFGIKRVKRSLHEMTLEDLENLLKNGKWIDTI